MTDYVEEYDCIGICQPDPVTGYCTGCGRPLNSVPVTAGVVQHKTSATKGAAPETSSMKATPTKNIS